MARTVAEAIASARGSTNDDEAARIKDPEMLRYVIDAVDFLYVKRPDLFTGKHGASWAALTLQSDLPIPDRFFRPLVDYLIGRCELKDDEYATSGRVVAVAQLAEGMLK